MKLKSKVFWLFISIALLAAFLRIYDLGKVPISLYWDETAFGYNAYSISSTMRDEYGNYMPLLFRSFDDYKLPGYVYLTAIPVKIFGLNEFSIRISSALLGVLTVIVTFFMVRTMLKLNYQYLKKKENLNSDVIALVSMLLLAISPWHIQFSRAGFEANAGLFFVVSGVWLFLRGLDTPKYFVFSSVMFATSLYFYRSIHLFLPFLLLGMIIIFRKELYEKRKSLLIPTSIFLILALPIAFASLSPDGLKRAKQVNVFSNSSSQFITKSNSLGLLSDKSIIFLNRRLSNITSISSNYFTQDSFDFIFKNGDPNKRHIPAGMGMMYLWELPFLLLGFTFLFKNSSKLRNFLLLWIIVAPIPVCLSAPVPHALRGLNILPVPQILVSFGIISFLLFFKKKMRYVFSISIVVVAALFLYKYLLLYSVEYSKLDTRIWGDGYKQAAEYIIPLEARYDKIIVSGHYWEPYIYFLFYKKYPPILFQEEGSSTSFGKYFFGGTSWDKEKNSQELSGIDLKFLAGKGKVLVLLSPDEYSNQQGNLYKLKEIRDNSGEVVFISAELK